MLQSAAPIPEEQVRRAVEAVFRARALNRTSLWDRFVAWLYEMWLRLWGVVMPVAATPVSRVITVLAALALLMLAARVIYLWHERSTAIAAGARWGGPATGVAGDLWAMARSLADRGDYTAAAHALYGALLESAARAQQIRLHPSKTAGDYARELRGHRSPLFGRFREFAGNYEVVIYGHQRCDLERYERLMALAAPMLHVNG